jgi:hypothetical protein
MGYRLAFANWDRVLEHVPILSECTGHLTFTARYHFYRP